MLAIVLELVMDLTQLEQESEINLEMMLELPQQVPGKIHWTPSNLYYLIPHIKS
jgi:hypothetical protein